ncbi:hypothetical protein [Bradyrhizobium stylosanthis]|nr:hypothetical protein [Bradyrhizobium stylosanthis]
MSRTIILPLADGDVAGVPRCAARTERPLPVRRCSAIPQLATAVLVITSASGAAFADPARCPMDASQQNVSSFPTPYRLEGCTIFVVQPPHRHGRDGSIRLAQAAVPGSGEPQQSPQPEPRKPEALSCELGSAKHDIELLQRLAQEHDRAEQLEQALAATRHDVEDRTALADKARDEAAQLKKAADGGLVDLRNSLQQERDRTGQLERTLATTQRDLDAQTALAAKASDEVTQLKKAADGGLVDLRNSLQQERDRTGELERTLAATQRELDAQTALATKASDEISRLTQAAKAGATERTRSIQKEHDRAEALAQDLSIARSKVYAYEAQAAKAAESAAQLKQAQESETASLGQSQQAERDRAERLARDLAKANRDLEVQTERASKASEEVLRLKQAGERDAAELRGMLQRERERAQGLETEIALARLDNGAFVARFPPPAPQPATVGTAVREEPIGARPQQLKNEPVQEAPVRDETFQDPSTGPRGAAEVRANPDEAAQVARLIARASLLLEQGDIGAARVVLEHVARMGNAQAIFVLAETYDPRVLPSFGTYGTHGDATKARDLYTRAEAGGVKEATARIEALGR